MRKNVGMACLILAMAAGMFMLPATRCEAAKVDVMIHLDLGATPPEIWVQDTKKFIGLCRKAPAGTKKHCTGHVIKWRLLVQGGTFDTNLDRVYILNAPDHPACFGQDPIAVFTDHNQDRESGIPSFACTEDKYGTYWPYVIEYRHDGAWMADIDPGGIIFP